MSVTRIPSDTIVHAPALPIHLDGGADAVLMIHGYTGYAGEMSYVAGRLHEHGFTVTVPRLPGHGTNGQDFLRVTWRDWLGHCIDRFLELRSRYRSVSVAGLSMGGILAALLAAQFHPQRVALLAPAHIVNNRLLPLTPLVAPCIKRRALPLRERESRSSGSGPAAAPGEITSQSPEEEAIEREYHRYEWIRPAAQLRRLQLMSRRSLHRIRGELLCVVSERDDTVPPRVADYIERRVSANRFERVVLKESGHLLVDDVERERVADLLIGWFSDGNVATSADGKPGE